MGDCGDDAGFDTLCLHGGWGSDPTTNSKGVPVYRCVIFADSLRRAPPLRTARAAAAGGARNAHVANFPRRFGRP